MSNIYTKKLFIIAFLSLLLIFSNFNQAQGSSTTTVDLNKMFTFTFNSEETIKTKSDNSIISYYKNNYQESYLFSHFNSTLSRLWYTHWHNGYPTTGTFNISLDSWADQKTTPLFAPYYYNYYNGTIVLEGDQGFMAELISSPPIVLNNDWTNMNNRIKTYYDNAKNNVFTWNSQNTTLSQYLGNFTTFSFDGSTNLDQAVSSLTNQNSWSMEYKASNTIKYDVGSMAFPFLNVDFKGSVSYNSNGLLNKVTADYTAETDNTTLTSSYSILLGGSGGIPGFEVLSVVVGLIALPIIIKLKKKFSK